MRKHELVKHLEVIHGAKITRPEWTTKAELDGAHATYHMRERAASDAFIKRGKKP